MASLMSELSKLISEYAAKVFGILPLGKDSILQKLYLTCPLSRPGLQIVFKTIRKVKFIAEQALACNLPF